MSITDRTHAIEDKLIGQGFASEVFGDIQNQRPTWNGETSGDCPFCGGPGKFTFSPRTVFAQCYKYREGSGGGRGNWNWFTYLQDRRRVADWREYDRLIHDRAGIQYEEDPKAAEAYTQRQARYETFRAAMEWCKRELWEPTGADVLTYLQEGRGYQPDTIRAMGLGAYTNGTRLQAHLAQLGYRQLANRDGTQSDEQRQTCPVTHLLRNDFGRTHRLVLPYPDAAGRLNGLALRIVQDGAHELKYLYTTGFSKQQAFVGQSEVRGKRVVLLTEGMLDALHLQTHQIPAVAAGGTAVSAQALKLLADAGTEAVALCLDNDGPGKNGTRRAIDLVLQAGMSAHVVNMPASIKDPNEYVLNDGPDAMREDMDNAVSWAQWLGGELLREFDITKSIGRERALSGCRKRHAAITDPIMQADFEVGVVQACAAAGHGRDAVLARLRGNAQTIDEAEQQRRDVRDASVLVVERMDAEIVALEVGRPRVKTMPTGFHQLDEKIDGWREGSFIVSAAQPNAGKTKVFGNYCAVNSALEGYPVGIVSLDMDSDTFVPYLATTMANMAGVNIWPSAITRPSGDTMGGVRLHEIRGAAAQYRGKLYCASLGRDVPLSTLWAYARIFHELGCVGMVVDQCECIVDWRRACRDGSAGARGDVVAEVKDIGRSLRIYVDMLHQCNRNGYQRPRPEDLYFSAEFYHRCDFMRLLHDPQTTYLNDQKQPGFVRVVNADGVPTGRVRPVRAGDDPKEIVRAADPERPIEIILAKSRASEKFAFAVEMDFVRGVVR